MKKILFLSLALSFYGSVNAQLFTQGFSSSTTVADYSNATTPTSGQFNETSTGSLSIETGELRLNRTVNTGFYAFRNYVFPTNPTFVQLKMDFRAVSSTANTGNTSPTFNVFIGSGFSASSTGSSNAYLCRFGIVYQNAVGLFKVSTVDNLTGTGVVASADNFLGKKTVTMIANNSGADKTYTAPDGFSETVANATMDIWVETTKALNDIPLRGVAGATAGSTAGVTGSSPAISGFKIQSAAAGGLGDFYMDNIEFTDLGGTLSTSNFENSVANATAYPNPTEGVFEINNLPLSLQTIELGLYSLDSKLLQSKTYNVNNGTVKLDISGLAKGIYFVKGDGNNPLVAKVVKE